MTSFDRFARTVLGRMSKGTLEGLESSWDSPGLGKRCVWWSTPPTVGEPFRCFHSKTRCLTTTPVQSVRRLAKDTLGFRTERTTYILRLEGEDGEASTD